MADAPAETARESWAAGKDRANLHLACRSNLFRYAAGTEHVRTDHPAGCLFGLKIASYHAEGGKLWEVTVF